MNKFKKYGIYAILGLTLCSSIVGCGKKNNKPTLNMNAVGNTVEEDTEKSKDKEDENLTYKSNEKINVSGTDLIMYTPYDAKFYGTDVKFVDIDFLSYNLGISLPQSVYNPNMLYMLDEDKETGLSIKKADTNKILLNFMDDYHYTTFCYSSGLFSTWSYTIDDETYKNLMFSDAYDVLALLVNEQQITYKNGYDFYKKYINKDENAYQIIMEIDYYPFEDNPTFYHGYLTLLVHGTDVRAVCFAEPKFNNTAPYQMGFPVIDSCYLLDVDKKTYKEEEDLEYYIQHYNETNSNNEDKNNATNIDENNSNETIIPTPITSDGETDVDNTSSNENQDNMNFSSTTITENKKDTSLTDKMAKPIEQSNGQ